MQHKQNRSSIQTTPIAMGFQRKQNGNLAIACTVSIVLLQGSDCLTMEFVEVAIICHCYLAKLTMSDLYTSIKWHRFLILFMYIVTIM